MNDRAQAIDCEGLCGAQCFGVQPDFSAGWHVLVIAADQIGLAYCPACWPGVSDSGRSVVVV